MQGANGGPEGTEPRNGLTPVPGYWVIAGILKQIIRIHFGPGNCIEIPEAGGTPKKTKYLIQD